MRCRLVREESCCDPLERFAGTAAGANSPGGGPPVTRHLSPRWRAAHVWRGTLPRSERLQPLRPARAVRRSGRGCKQVRRGRPSPVVRRRVGGPRTSRNGHSPLRTSPAATTRSSGSQERLRVQTVPAAGRPSVVTRHPLAGRARLARDTPRSERLQLLRPARAVRRNGCGSKQFRRRAARQPSSVGGLAGWRMSGEGHSPAQNVSSCYDPLERVTGAAAGANSPGGGPPVARCPSAGRAPVRPGYLPAQNNVATVGLVVGGLSVAFDELVRRRATALRTARSAQPKRRATGHHRGILRRKEHRARSAEADRALCCSPRLTCRRRRAKCYATAPTSFSVSAWRTAIPA